MAHPSVPCDLQPLGLWRHFPARPCLLCGLRSVSGDVCALCRQALDPSRAPCRCPRCALALPALCLLACPDCGSGQWAAFRVVAAFDYEHPGDILIHGLKISHQLEAVSVLAELMVRQWRRSGVSLDDEAWVLCVPSRPAALRRRGFNPGAMLTRRVARLLGLRARTSQVYWTRPEGLSQKQLGRRARRSAMQGAFGLRPGLSGRPVLLVDDVLTTGATLNALAQACLDAGAVSVHALVAARAPWKTTRI